MAFRLNRQCLFILGLTLVIVTLLIIVFQIKWDRSPLIVYDHQSDANHPWTQDRVVDVFRYYDPGFSGSGTTSEELSRVQLYSATQQAVCQNITRLGGKATTSPDKDPDGAWEICFDREVQFKPDACIVYSFGISEDWSFDEQMERNAGCEVFSFDPSIGLEDHQHSPKIKFFNTGLSDVDSEAQQGIKDNKDARGWKMRTLGSIIKQLGHSDKIIDVLKMDIEGSEWNSIPQILASDVMRRQVKQLTVEYHLTNESAGGYRKYYGIMKWLERQGFLIFNKHQNDFCIQCLEMSYVNMNLVKLHTNTFYY